MAGLPARRRRAATLIWLPGALCFESPGFFSSCVDAGRHPPSEPSVYHSRGSHAPPNPSSFPGSSQPCSTREKAAHLPGERARAARHAQKWRRSSTKRRRSMRMTCAAAPPFLPPPRAMSRGQPQSRRATATRTPHPPSPQKYPTPTQKKPVTDLQHNAANRVDTAHAHEYTKGKMLELAGFMKHLHDGIPIRRHLENGREDKICIRGAGEAGDDGVAWDGLCCSKARTSLPGRS